MIYDYVCISTQDQNEDKQSGEDFNNPPYKPYKELVAKNKSQMIGSISRALTD